jgi:hypothetical protein
MFHSCRAAHQSARLTLARPVGVGLGSLVLEVYRALSLVFGFLGVSSSGKLGFTRSLRRALSVLPMVRRSFALLLEPSRLAAGHPVDSRGDNDDSDEDEYNHQWIVHKDLLFSSAYALCSPGTDATP